MAERGSRKLAERLTAEIAQAVVDGIDVDAIVQRIDVQAVAARVDPDEIAERIDVNAIIDRVDLDAIVDRIDVTRILERIDLDAVVRRVDLNRLVDGLDVPELVRRASLGGPDGRIAPDVVLGLVDVQGVVDRIDLGPALRDAGLAEIVAESVSRTALTQLRRNVTRMDVLTQRVLAVGLRQDLADWPAGPPELVGGRMGVIGSLGDDLGRPGRLDGHYAGPFARVTAIVGDVIGSLGTYTLLHGWALGLLTSVFGIVDADAGGSASRGTAWLAGLVLWLGAWFLAPLLVTGRTPVMGLLGLRVVARDGEPLPAVRTVIRALLLVPSVLLSGAGFVTVLFDKQRGAVHDLLVGSVVVFDWGGETSRVATPVTRYLERHATT